jgi:hypothetical protein
MADDVEQKKAAARKVVGEAIINGLLTGFNAQFRMLQDYTQGTGGYWQTDGGSHIQSGGDYHQT